ncbi:MAG: hypothetical protein HOG49_35470 [Candidatus Scalindua sp.]|jgi:hypothetical protein|nr:hypothetical protein [Candidatus Scalindua sp.]
MKIKLKKNKKISANYNNYGLDLNDWYKLQSGGTLDVEYQVHPKLFDFVYVIKKKEKKNG